MSEADTAVTIEIPGHPPIHTSTDGMRRATEKLEREIRARALSEPAAKDEPATRFAKDHLKSIVERIERLEEEKAVIASDIRDVYAESKGNGFDVKALRAVIRLRKQDVNERQEQETILETYMQALGML